MLTKTSMQLRFKKLDRSLKKKWLFWQNIFIRVILPQSWFLQATVLLWHYTYRHIFMLSSEAWNTFLKVFHMHSVSFCLTLFTVTVGDKILGGEKLYNNNNNKFPFGSPSRWDCLLNSISFFLSAFVQGQMTFPGQWYFFLVFFLVFTLKLSGMELLTV